MQSNPLNLNLGQLKTILSEFFSGEERVTVAYLFGSTIRGETSCLSDIDIAVLFDEILTKKKLLTFS